jgi:hypothetical protein
VVLRKRWLFRICPRPMGTDLHIRTCFAFMFFKNSDGDLNILRLSIVSCSMSMNTNSFSKVFKHTCDPFVPEATQVTCTINNSYCGGGGGCSQHSVRFSSHSSQLWRWWAISSASLIIQLAPSLPHNFCLFHSPYPWPLSIPLTLTYSSLAQRGRELMV